MEINLKTLDFSLKNLDEIDKIDKRDSDELAEEAELRGNITKIKSKASFFKYKKLHFEKLKIISQLFQLPKENEQVRVITQESFNSYTFLLFISQTEKVEELHFTTFNMKDVIIQSLFELFNTNQINKLSIMISESVNFRMPERVQQLKGEFNKYKNTGRVRVKLNWNHSKIMLIKTTQNYYCIEGSGNLSDNAQIEQYVFDNSKQIYDFHMNWINEAFSHNLTKREEIWQ